MLSLQTNIIIDEKSYSSVAAYLLKEQGYDVIGLFMKNWHDDSVTISNECPWLEDSNDAMLVAEKLGIPFQVVDLSEQYKERIVDYMFREYEMGRTPNVSYLKNNCQNRYFQLVNLQSLKSGTLPQN